MQLNLNHADVTIDKPVSPPAWALMERELIRAQTSACETFFAKYFDERGYLKCIPRWGGNDGPDDAIENLVHWPTLHVLGGSDSLMEMCKLAWVNGISSKPTAEAALFSTTTAMVTSTSIWSTDRPSKLPSAELPDVMPSTAII